jgi:hypothetical protein
LRVISSANYLLPSKLAACLKLAKNLPPVH